MNSLLKTRNSSSNTTWHKITPLVFLFFFLVMLSSSGGHLDVWDGKGYFLLTENIVKHHSLILQPDLTSPETGPGSFTIRNYFSWLYSLLHDGKYLPANSKLEPTPSHASPLFALIGVPFYIIAENIHYSTVKFTSYFVNSLILALMSTVVFAFGSQLYRSQKIGFALSLVAGVGSFAWPYVSSNLEQPLTALILVSCLYFLHLASGTNTTVSKNRSQGDELEHQLQQKSKIVKFSPMLAGLFLGLQSFAHPGTIVLVPGIAIIALYILRKDKTKILQFVIAFLLLVAAQLYINEFRFGSITEFGYGFTAKAAHIYVEGLYGLLLSPGLGLIVYFPLIALFPLAVYYLWGLNKVFCIAFLYVFFSLLFFYGTLDGVLWTGLGGWGPRYMITVIPLLALTSGSIMTAVSKANKSKVQSTQDSTHISSTRLAHFKGILKILFTALAFSGFLINLLGVLVWYQIGFSYGFGPLHVNQLPDKTHYYKYFAWNPKYAPVLLNWKVLTTDWWKSLRDVDPIYYGWKTCIPDNFLYCNFGIMPLLAALVASLSAGFVITHILFTTRKVFSLGNRRAQNRKP